MKNIVLILALCVLTGCVATTPAFGGKTRAETTFIDADGTQYIRNVELPAGVQLEGQDAMSYEWTADTGKINIGQSGKGDTLRQAESLDLGTQANLQMIQGLTSLVGVVAELAAPLIGQNLTLDAAQAQTDSANDLAIRTSLVDRLDTLFERLGTAQKSDADRMTQIEEKLGALIDSLGGTSAGTTP